MDYNKYDEEPKSFVVEVEEDENGELLLPLPLELINQMGWDEETILDWELMDNGTVVLKEVKE